MPNPCSTDRIKIFVRECTVPLFIGIYDHEKPKAQSVVIDVELTASPVKNLQDATIHDVIDYDRVYHYLTEALPKLGHINLLENVAECIVAFCFEDPRIEKVRVRLAKSDIYKDKALVGIEIKRHRNAS